VAAQWHQWLRYVREHPPSIEEQQQDLTRQAQIKQLARLADERWASKPSFLDKPKTQQPTPATNTTDATLNRPADETATTANSQNASASTTAAGTDPTPKTGGTRSGTKPASTEESAKEEDPWAKASNPGDNWQPESWNPTSRR